MPDGERPEACKEVPASGPSSWFNPKSWACDAYKGLFEWPDTSNDPDTKVVQALLTVEDFAGPNTNLAQVGDNMAAIGLGVLGASMTFAILQFWLSGLTSMNAGLMGAQGLARGVGAALLIVLWPWIFEQAVAATNVLATSVVAGGMQERAGRMLTGMLTDNLASGAVSLILLVILSLLFLLLLIGLFLLKVALSGSLAVLFVAMPIVVALWPVPYLAFLAKLAGKLLVVLLMIPVVWAIVFAAVTGMGLDALTMGNLTHEEQGWLHSLTQSLSAIVLLGLLIVIPLKLLQLAALAGLLPGGGGGGATGAVSANALRNTLPHPFGNRARKNEVQWTEDALGNVHVNPTNRAGWQGNRATGDSREGQKVQLQDELQQWGREAERVGDKATRDADRGGRWAQDAQRHSDDIQQRLDKHEESRRNGRSETPPPPEPDLHPRTDAERAPSEHGPEDLNYSVHPPYDSDKDGPEYHVDEQGQRVWVGQPGEATESTHRPEAEVVDSEYLDLDPDRYPTKPRNDGERRTLDS